MDHSESVAKHTGRPVTWETASSLPAAYPYPAPCTTEWCVCAVCCRKAQELRATLALLEALPEPKAPPGRSFRQILHDREAPAARRLESPTGQFAHAGFTHQMIALLLTPALLLAVALLSGYAGGLAWIGLLVGVVPYIVRRQKTGEGQKVVVRSLFWSLAIGIGGEFSQGRSWSLRVPAVEGFRSLINTRS